MDLARFIQIYVVQGLFALFFLYLAILVLKRGKMKLNLYLSSFYLSTTIGGIVNMIYATIFVEMIVFIMHFLTYYLFCFSMVFLLIFVLIHIRPDKQFKFKFQFVVILIFGLLILGMLLIPNGIIIDASTNWKPNWNWNFLIYSIIVCSFTVVCPTISFSIKIYIKRSF